MSFFKVFVFFFQSSGLLIQKGSSKAMIFTVRRGSLPLVFVLRETLGLDFLLLALK